VRRILLIAITVALIAAGALFGYRAYDNYNRSEECVEDTLHFIHELYEIRSGTNEQPFVDAYRFQQHVIDARRLLSPWLSDSQSDRHRIAEAAEGALSEFERAANLYLQLNHGADKEALAEFTVKADSGRQRLAEIAAAIHKHPPPLTTRARHRLVGYVDRVFGDDLARQRASKDDPKAQLYWEVVAVSLIRHDLESPSKASWKDL
jgi:hypothetical protein